MNFGRGRCLSFALASCPECGAKWFRVGDRIVLAGQRIGPKRALTAKPIRGVRRTSGYRLCSAIKT
jgi:hypothetical protein